MKAPAFQWYPADYIGSQRVQLMTLEQEGAYIRLLCYCWLHGSIPDDINLIITLLGKGATATVAEVVMKMFKSNGKDRLIHERLEAEKRKQLQWRLKSAQGGLAARKKRKNTSQKSVDNQHPDKGWNSNGTKGGSALHLLSSSSSNNPSEPSASPGAQKVPRARDEVLDALAAVDGSDPTQVTKGAWPGIATARANIKAVFPNLTATEINRRAANYRAHYPTISISAHALAKHWALCDNPPSVSRNGHPQQTGPLRIVTPARPAQGEIGYGAND